MKSFDIAISVFRFKGTGFSSILKRFSSIMQRECWNDIFVGLNDMVYTSGLICLVIYLCCSLFLFIAVLFQLHLAKKANQEVEISDAQNDKGYFPRVTIQVPVYNERYVIADLLRALGKIDYPLDRFEIQVLDDSTDDTSSIISQEVSILKRHGIDVKIFHRSKRPGFKAGALQAALPFASGDFIAIFDADFTPNRDFILRMTRHFKDPRVGMVQGRWVHRNLWHNRLTRIQAFLLDSHFQVDQQGRAASDYFVSFNGTAGMWRKQCIIDAGGWNPAILTEDIDLSYRAQLRGWICKYDNDVTVLSDLPEHITAFKVQQFRWAKGMTQAAVQHVRKILSASLSGIKKLHAIFHLTAGTTFLAVTGTVLMSLPVLIARHYSESFRGLSSILIATAIILPLICVYYYKGTKASVSTRFFWSNLPAFLVIFMALSVQNSIAVLEALIGKSGSFVRTPKVRKLPGDKNCYVVNTWTSLNTIEFFMSLYVATGLMLSILWNDYFLVSFFAMMLTGLTVLLWSALADLWRRLKYVSRNSGDGEPAYN